jgi:hypothetical protein
MEPKNTQSLNPTTKFKNSEKEMFVNLKLNPNLKKEMRSGFISIDPVGLSADAPC